MHNFIFPHSGKRKIIINIFVGNDTVLHRFGCISSVCNTSETVTCSWSTFIFIYMFAQLIKMSILLLFIDVHLWAHIHIYVKEEIHMFSYFWSLFVSCAHVPRDSCARVPSEKKNVASGHEQHAVLNMYLEMLLLLSCYYILCLFFLSPIAAQYHMVSHDMNISTMKLT